MQVKRTNSSDTKVILNIELGEESLKEAKRLALVKLQREVSAPGFRKGKAPLNIVEKQADEKYLQTEILNAAINKAYIEAAKMEEIRPLDDPEVEVTKFVPESSLSFTATVQIIPNIKLADYKKFKKKLGKIEVTDGDVNEVIENLRLRSSEKKPVERAAKDKDEIWIDFDGKDAKGEAVAGASGKDYPLSLGSKTFIPGFEENLLGVKAGDKKEFTVTFPKDYQHKPLANQKVTFAVSVKKVQEVILPEVDDNFAKKLGPFKSVENLKSDIKEQLVRQKTEEAENKLKDEIIEELVEKSTIPVPEILAEDQIKSLEEDLRQNLVYRGITLSEYVKQLGKTEEEYRDTELRTQAERRVKVGLALSEVAEQEGLKISDEEINIRMQVLKNQYSRPDSQAEFERPEMRREIASRMMTEKTVDALVGYATS